MNHARNSAIVWKNTVAAAKASNRGLNIFPRDRERITLEDLPLLPEGWAAQLQGRKWEVIPVDTTKMLQQVVKVGRSYALGLPMRDPDGFYMVVEQG